MEYNPVVSLLRLKVVEMEAKWFQQVNRLLLENDDPTYTISRIYFVFSGAINSYSDFPDIVAKASFYANCIIDVIESITNAGIRALADRINGGNKSIPTNLLFWVDIIEKQKIIIFEIIKNKMRGFIDIFLRNFNRCEFSYAAFPQTTPLSDDDKINNSSFSASPKKIQEYIEEL